MQMLGDSGFKSGSSTAIGGVSADVTVPFDWVNLPMDTSGVPGEDE